MAKELERLFAETDVYERGILSMGGHENGLISFGTTAQKATDVLSVHLGRVL